MGALVLSQLILVPILGALWYGIRQERKQIQYEYKKAISTVSFLRSRRYR